LWPRGLGHAVDCGHVDYGPHGHSQPRAFQTCGRQLATWTIIYMANVPHGFCPRGWRVGYVVYTRGATWQLCHVAMWTAWPRCELHISQQLDQPRYLQVASDTWLTVHHVYGPHTHGKLQVANYNFFFFFYSGEKQPNFYSFLIILWVDSSQFCWWVLFTHQNFLVIVVRLLRMVFVHFHKIFSLK